MIKLSDRLKIVYDMIPSCASAADIGCDHGYLSIALVEGKKAKRVLAMDINKGPVEAAKEHVKLYGKEDFIEVRRSDGLDELKENEAQVIAICGMGGNLMRRIMEKHIDLCQRAEALVVEWLDKDEAEYKRIHMQLAQKLSGLTEAEGRAIRDRLLELSFEIDTIDAARFALGR